MKDYINLCVRSSFSNKNFINEIIKIRTRYFAFTAIIVCMLLFLPVFITLVRLNPTQLYSRLYSIDINDFHQLSSNIDQLNIDIVESDGAILDVIVEKESLIEDDKSGIAIIKKITDEKLSKLDITKKHLIFSEEEIVYIDINNQLAMDIKLLPSKFLNKMDYKEIFDYLSISNNYFGKFLFSISNLLLAVVFVLQLLFYCVVALLLALVGLKSNYIKYLDRIKILLVLSITPSIICTLIGFFLPAIHLFLFQILVMLLAFKSYKNYEKCQLED